MLMQLCRSQHDVNVAASSAIIFIITCTVNPCVIDIIERLPVK